MLISLGLYLAGLLMLVRRFFAGDRIRQSLLCCFGLWLWPFLGRTLLNGQLSSVGFFAIALAICLEDAGWPFLSGLALSSCIYKPTLLLLILPMILVTRRFKSLAGVAVGAATIVALTTLIEGTGVWPAYIQMSVDFSHLKDIIAPNYVDVFASSRDVRQAWPLLSWGIFAGSAIVGSFLIRVWCLGAYAAHAIPANLIWGFTITWTLVLNIYVPIYDTILVVISIIITAEALSKDSRLTFSATCAAILISSYVTVQIAAATGVQILSVLLAVLGVLQMRLCVRSLNSRRPLIEGGNESLLGLRKNMASVATAAEEGYY